MVRERHPLEGCSLAVVGWMRRRGALELLVALTDGSRVFVEAAWTDLEVAVRSPDAGTLGTLGSLEDLLAVRRVLDGLSRSGGDAGCER